MRCSNVLPISIVFIVNKGADFDNVVLEKGSTIRANLWVPLIEIRTLFAD